MLDNAIRILNFDNSIIRQEALLRKYRHEIVDFTGLAARARLFMSGLMRREIDTCLASGQSNRPTFLGSGDFHHISEVLTSRIDQPACLIVFDFHPDWDSLPPRFGCGSWVTQALKNKNIVKCVLIGMGSDDLSGFTLQAAGLDNLAGGRLEIYPFKRKPGRVYFRRLCRNPSLTIENGFFSSRIIWHELGGEDLPAFVSDLARRLPVPRAYISIDKDCLKNNFALTNWEEGLLGLDQLLAMLDVMRRRLEIIGLDITGDYSPALLPGRFKATLSRLDHPKQVAADSRPAKEITAINQQTNLEILGTLFS